MFKRVRLLAATSTLLVFGSANAELPELAATGSGDTGRATSVVTPRTSISPHAQLTRFLLQPVDDPNRLRGYRIAILAADGVDGFDLQVPRDFLVERGATVHIIVPRPFKALQSTGSGPMLTPKTSIAVLEPSGEQRSASFDRFVDQVEPDDYDAIYLPGYLTSSSDLAEPRNLAFLQEAARAGKSIFAAGNSPVLLVKAGLFDDRQPIGEAARLSSPASSTLSVVEDPLVNDGNIYAARDAFDMPILMDRLATTLLERPVYGQ
jgi:protease I